MEGKKSSMRSRMTPKSTADPQGTSSLAEEGAEDQDKETNDLEQELQRMIHHSLGDCSRQRLRALQMALRRMGNIESRISVKDLNTVLQDNQVKLSGRAFQMLIELYEDSIGIDYELLLRSLVIAQSRSGRDSVIAQTRRNDEAGGDGDGRAHMTPEERDGDLVKRLEQQLLRADEEYSLAAVRANFQQRDTDKAGKLAKQDVLEICSKNHLPIYGALLNALLNRCDEQNSGQSSWPEVMSFLDQAYTNLVVSGQITEEKPPESKEPKQIQKEEVPDQGMSEPIKKQLVKNAFQKVLGKERPMTPTNLRTPQGNIPSPKTIQATTGFLNSMKGLLKGKKPEGAIPVATIPKEAKVEAKSEAKSESKPDATVKPLKIETPKEDSKPGPLSPKPQAVPSSPVIPPKSPSAHKPSAKPSSKPSPGPPIPTKGMAYIEVKGHQVQVPVADEFKNRQVNTDPPQERLKLEWVYGYRGNDTRSNIYNLKSGEVVYFIGSVSVLYSIQLHQQRHYREHTADIQSIAVHSNKMTVATGQKDTAKGAKDAHIRVWRCDTLQTVHTIGVGVILRSPIALSFSIPKEASLDSETSSENKSAFSEERLCCVDNGTEHQLHVWDVSNGAHIASAPLGIEQACDVDFSPLDPRLMVVTGKEHLGWWQLDTENKAIQFFRKPDYQNYLRAKYVTALLHTERGDLITGDSNGTVYVWGRGGNLITNLVKHAHQGPIFALYLCRGSLVTGGRDGYIYGWTWNKNMDQIAKMQVPIEEGGVRMLQIHGSDQLLIGTTTNSILTATLAGPALRNPLSGALISSVPLTQGHYDEILSICVPISPREPHQIFTAGRDGAIAVFNTATKRPVWKHVIKGMRIYCADINATGTCIVVGSRDVVAVYLLEKEEVVPEEDKGGKEEGKQIKYVWNKTEIFSLALPTDGHRLSVVKLAPDGQAVCAGDSGGCLYRVALGPDEEGNQCWQLHSKTTKAHDGRIEDMDWSLDRLPGDNKHPGGTLLRTSCSSLQLNMWYSGTLERVENLPDCRNLRWASATCKLNYVTAGMWHSKQAVAADVTAVDISPYLSLLVMADSHGYLSLFRYPCTKKGESNVMRAHHGHVTSARFTHGDRSILSVSASELPIMQWKVVYPQ